MKRKIILIICIIILICIGSCCSIFPKVTKERYEQHLEAQNISDSGSIETDDLITHLPIISISTNGQKIPGSSKVTDDNDELETSEKEIKVEINIYDNEEAKNSIKNEMSLASSALIKVRGNTSRKFDKSSYKISFITDDGIDKDVEVMGMDKSNEWVLNGPYLDKTLIRNYMWYNISAKIMGDAPDVRFCECYIDGVYEGLYIMVESVNESNVPLYSQSSNRIEYLIKLDKIDSDNEKNNLEYSTTHLKSNTGFSIVYPTKFSQDMKEYIENDLMDLEKLLYESDYSIEEYDKYLELDSWVDFYIISEFVLNTDMCFRSTYLYKNMDGKIAIGPVWDFNNVCDNYISKAINIENFHFAQGKIWYDVLLKDEKFVEKVKERYKELRTTYLNEEYLLDYIDETIEYLGEAVDRNYEVWGYTFLRENQTESEGQYLKPVERNPENYEEAIIQYKNFIIVRGKWLDENIEFLSS